MERLNRLGGTFLTGRMKGDDIETLSILREHGRRHAERMFQLTEVCNYASDYIPIQSDSAGRCGTSYVRHSVLCDLLFGVGLRIQKNINWN